MGCYWAQLILCKKDTGLRKEQSKEAERKKRYHQCLEIALWRMLTQPQAKRFSDEWKEQDEEGVHLFNHKLLLQFFVEALQDDIRAQRRKSGMKLFF